MPHYAVICPEDAGHLLSVGALGVEMARRGHRVTLVARPKAGVIAAQLGLDMHPLENTDFRSPFPYLLWAACWLIGAPYFAVFRHWVQWRSELALRFLPDELRSLGVDGLAVDQSVLAGGTVADRLGLPHVTVCSALPYNEEPSVPPPFTAWANGQDRWSHRRNRIAFAAWRWHLGPTMRIINRHRRSWGLRPFGHPDDTFSPLAQISQMCPELDFPRLDPPRHFHHIGSLAAARRVTPDRDFPWDRLDGRPLVFASLGTVPDSSNVAAFRRILAACAPLDAQIVLTVGRWEEKRTSLRDKLGKIPTNALVVDFAPQLELLDRASALITHAGINTVLEAITKEVPMVALPRSADQPGMGARISRSGIGLVGSFARSTSSQIRDMVTRVLADTSFRERTRQMRRSLETAGGAPRAAVIAEEALTTRRPVCRK